MVAYPLNGQRVLEVGCGLALASLIVHRRSGDVTASDCHPLVPEFLRVNRRSTTWCRCRTSGRTGATSRRGWGAST
jgi:tRNA1(Val) A37 N6-methylase TrmN6